MADTLAFQPPDGQSEYAFPGTQGGGDDDAAAQSDQRNQQIQSAFDSQRFQRGFIQNVAKSMQNQGAQIERLRQQAAAKPSSTSSSGG
jgi:hypothetical protein